MVLYQNTEEKGFFFFFFFLNLIQLKPFLLIFEGIKHFVKTVEYCHEQRHSMIFLYLPMPNGIEKSYIYSFETL